MSEETSTAIECRATGGALVKHDYAEYDGQGFENQTQEDRAIPFLGLAQDMSPQVKKNKPEYIEGLEVGGLFNSVTGELLGERVLFIPAVTEHVYTLWVPRNQGGGFRGRLGIDDPVVAEAKAAAVRAGKRLNELKNPEGLDIVETFYVWGIAQIGDGDEMRLEPIVVSITSTKIGVYKKWQTRLGQFQVHNPATGRKHKPPLFAHLTSIGSCDDQNNQGQDFKNLTIGPAVNNDIAESLLAPDDPRFVLGKQLRDLVQKGQAKAAYESQSEGSGDSDGDIPF